MLGSAGLKTRDIREEAELLRSLGTPPQVAAQVLARRHALPLGLVLRLLTGAEERGGLSSIERSVALSGMVTHRMRSGLSAAQAIKSVADENRIKFPRVLYAMAVHRRLRSTGAM